jgi:RNA polymerase sigma factor (sigma-70 family)
MDEGTPTTDRFEEHRRHLRAVATRILGSSAEADDAVQEAWIRFSRADTSTVDNLGGWLTTVVSRVCLNMLQARRSRPGLSVVADTPEGVEDPQAGSDPEEEAVLADSIGLALMVVLDTLSPSERVAFVLHDIFGLSFDEIAPVVDRTPAAARQLASRARRRVQGREPSGEADRIRQAELVGAFLGAARRGDFEGLLTVLDPDVELRVDETAVSLGASAMRGSSAVATFLRRSRGALAALIEGEPGAVWMPEGQLKVAFLFSVGVDSITAVELVADPDRLGRTDLVVLDEVSGVW